MGKSLPWITGISVSILAIMFFVELPLEIILLILWMNGNEGLTFFITSLWKWSFVVAIIISPFFGYRYSKKKFF